MKTLRFIGSSQDDLAAFPEPAASRYKLIGA